MRRNGLWNAALAAWVVGLVGGAAPAPTSYDTVEQTIQRIQKGWDEPGARPQPNRPGWEAFFRSLQAELNAYATAPNRSAQLTELGRLHQMSSELQGVGWSEGEELREALRAWLRPRVRLAWAEERLIESVQGLPQAPNQGVQGNRQRWVDFVNGDLDQALRGYDGAQTIMDRLNALEKIRGAIQSLKQANASQPWEPTAALQTALTDLFEGPNFNATADEPTLKPALNQPVVQPGPITFEGRTSWVTDGPMTGFGLLPSDEGILFYNSQMMTSVTPITDFQQQVAEDRRGRLAARLYYFNATSVNHAQLTITALLRPTGLQLAPGYLHNIDASIGSNPTAGCGPHTGRSLTSLLGLDQESINNRVYEGAIAKIRDGVVEGSAKLAAIKTNEAAIEKNRQLWQYLIGNNRLEYRNLLIEDLSLRSRPGYALIGGRIEYLNAAGQVGADTPKPPQFATTEPGVVADVNLPSIMTNLSRGALQSPAYRDIKNIMLVTKKVPPGTPPREGVVLTQDADFETFSEAVTTAQAANDPKVMAIRLLRPDRLPDFAADANGHLVVLLHNLVVEVPAPAQAARGGLFGPAARIYRISMPEAEVSISFQIEPAHDDIPIKLSGRVENFDPGPDAQILSINRDENQTTPLNAFTKTVALNVMSGKIKGQPIDLPLSDLKLPNMSLNSVSPLDPSGWLRVILSSTGGQGPPPIAQPPST